MEASGERADAARDNNLSGLPVIAQRRRKGSALGKRYRQRLHCLRLDWKLVRASKDWRSCDAICDPMKGNLIGNILDKAATTINNRTLGEIVYTI